MSKLDAVLTQIDSNLNDSVDRLFDFLRIQSISTDPAYQKNCQEAADWLTAELNQIGFDAKRENTPGHPMVIAKGGEGAKHYLFYGHYDVQPVDPLSLWSSDPFDPQKENTDSGVVIRARGAADDKGQLMTFVEACRAFQQVNGELPAKLTLFFEGEEGGEVLITGPDRDLHSGMYGGPAQNPIRVLTKILAELHDDSGRITLPGFYDGVDPIPNDIQQQWESLNHNGIDFLNEVGLSVPAGEDGVSVLEQIWARPSCDINGINGGYTGEGFKTVLPSQAMAKVSFRLVGRQDPTAIEEAFKKFVIDRLPEDCSAEFTLKNGSAATVMPVDAPAFGKAHQALTDEWPNPAVYAGCGGSIPVVGHIKEILNMDSLLIGFGLDDDAIHSPNEKYNLTSFHKGIRSWARVLSALS